MPTRLAAAAPVRLVVDRTWDGGAAAPGEVALVTLAPTPGGGALRVQVDAPFHGDPPPDADPGPTDGLWNHEVVELFLGGGGPAYLEVELGPHGHHLVLQLADRRRPIARGLPLDFTARIDGDRWAGTALLPAAWLPTGRLTGNAHAIHGAGEARRHLAAFPVPGPAPDFHQPERFRPLEKAPPPSCYPRKE